MLRYNKIKLENFGVYVDEKITFPETGVVVVTSENFRGKTTLLNAFRFAFTGKIKGRFAYANDKNYEEKVISSFVNTEMIEEKGIDSFTVTLDFQKDEDNFQIIRRGSLRDNVTHQKVFDLLKNGTVVPLDEKNQILESIMNDAISKFFLFDAELLGQYESLLEESHESDLVRNSIEEMLGVPRVIQIREYVKLFYDDLEKDKNTLLKKIPNEEELANSFLEISDAITNYERDLADRTKELTNLKKENEELRNRIDLSKEQRELQKEIEDLKGKLQTLIDNRSDIQDLINEKLKNGWFLILKDLLESRAASTEMEQNNLRVDIPEIKRLLENSINNNHCKMCNQSINQEIANKLATILSDDNNAGGLIASELLKNFNNEDRDSLMNSFKDYDDKEIDISDLEQKIKNKRNLINKNFNLDSMNTDWETYNTNEQKIGVLNESIKQIYNHINDKEKEKEELDKKVEKISNSDELKELNKKLFKIKKMKNFFTESVDAYRNLMRNEVMNKATEFFKNVILENDYKKLKITDSFGLQIITKSGEVNPNDSAGLAAIVAYSLITAIHNVKDESAPLVLDAAFERIDHRRQEKIVAQLPNVSKQLLILGLEKDIGTSIFNILGDNVKAHYVLARSDKSNFKTIIRKLS
jgi:DNA sulfur modification protein DndD